jgi:hypothetical protein
MPTATFYPSTLTQPGAGEGAFINGVDAQDWVDTPSLTSNITRATIDSDLTTNEGRLTSPNVNSLAPQTPPTITDARLATQFAYTRIAAASTSVMSKMARGVALKRVGDNADLSTVIPATATAITAISVSFRFSDTSYGVGATGGSGAAVYAFKAQQRNTSGVIGSLAQITSIFDYTGINLYAFYYANSVAFGTLPTVAQIRDAAYGINFRVETTDSLESTQYIGINGLTLAITWDAPANKPRRQIVRLSDGRIAAARARIR